MNHFSTSHPIVLLLYYIVVMLVTILFIHPLVLIISLVGSFCLTILTKSWIQIWKYLRVYSFLFLIIFVTNPLFVHEGETVIFEIGPYPYTLEAVFYGVCIAMMLISIINWSKLYSDMITTDKFIYLFGKSLPKLSLILTITLRFIPLFIKRIRKISMTQQTFGMYPGNSIKHRILRGIQTFHIITTWSLESSIMQADSMKARGYSTGKRTNYAMFSWSPQDTFITIMTGIFIIIIMYFNSRGKLLFQFYPELDRLALLEMNVTLWITLTMFIFLPSSIEIGEKIKWKYIQSKM